MQSAKDGKRNPVIKELQSVDITKSKSSGHKIWSNIQSQEDFHPWLNHVTIQNIFLHCKLLPNKNNNLVASEAENNAKTEKKKIASGNRQILWRIFISQSDTS